ncbi:hypothetical protein CEE36_02895 [candidate division TA06 bacterium B3_TA06]|uniref:Uncharacterized protein n=1 Tax=candidate division TA06 bacterium B3_TA06 TaxID=2012487 RepID=A0A532V9J6_UNCT6|nr:MAG: hypothetical protein CEE36_02895 [candidate division TA06 bacterium B3_TA06]
MSTPKKILLTGLAVILLLGATPLAAQIAGRWEGTGTGEAYPPCHPPIHPWQIWMGEIPLTQDVFTGEWCDADCNHGTFKGEIAPFSTPEEAYCEGYWTWDDPSSPSIIVGHFKMTFYILEGICEGTWTSIWPSPSGPGTMKGWKID